jgi:hypothetical protein
MMVEFVCNLPGPADKVAEMLQDFPMTTSVQPREFAELDPSWPRVGDNYVGEPFGKHREGDVGVYVVVLCVKPWPRSVTYLSDAPTGIHPHHRNKYIRNIKTKEKDE